MISFAVAGLVSTSACSLSSCPEKSSNVLFARISSPLAPAEAYTCTCQQPHVVVSSMSRMLQSLAKERSQSQLQKRLKHVLHHHLLQSLRSLSFCLIHPCLHLILQHQGQPHHQSDAESLLKTLRMKVIPNHLLGVMTALSCGLS